MRFHSYQLTTRKTCQLWFAAWLLFLVLFLGSCAPVKAANLTNAGNVWLAWDKSPTDLLTNGVTYSIHATNQTSFSFTNVFAGTNLSVLITNMDSGRWLFTATARQAGIDSLPSNVLVFDVPAVAPASPGQFRSLFLDTTLTFTNWTTFQAFRMRLQ